MPANNRRIGSDLEPPPALRLRSVALGLLGSALIAAATPFNNFVLNNTFLVGNLMPAAAIGLLLLTVTVVNVPLRRCRWTRPFSTGELAVAFSMWLVACTIPSGGLMRYLPGHLIAPFHTADSSPAYREIIKSSIAADWLYPTFDTEDLEERGRDPLVRHYVAYNPDASGLSAVPWKRWLRPALAWGGLIVMLYGAVLCLTSILHHQWARNERLSFPLAEVYSSLLEAPEPGKALPAVLRSTRFWLAAGAVLLLHLSNGIAQYERSWPAIPMAYDLNALFSEQPFSFMTYGAKAAKIMITVVGVCYFIPTKVAGSLLFFFALYNVVQMQVGSMGYSMTLGMQRDHTLGALAVLALTIIYTGRHHWRDVLKAMIGRGRPEQPEQTDPGLSPAFPGWLLIVLIAGITTWLTLAGSPVLNSLLIVIALLTLFVITARIVAETGLIYVQIHTAIYRPWIMAADVGLTTSKQGYFLLGKIYSVFGHDLRENSMVYATSGFATAERLRVPFGRRWGLASVMLLSLVVAFFVGGASMLVCEYNHEITLDSSAQLVNSMSTYLIPRENVFDVVRNFSAAGATGFPETHSRPFHVGIGAAATAAVVAGHLGWSGFPLHPIGAVMCYSYALQNTWFSILLGFLAKVLIVRLGGSTLYRSVKPVFLGLILGETLAILAWVVINIVLASLGIEYQQINILI
jgi:hypothetical protein